jgi:hypothetical protein
MATTTTITGQIRKIALEILADRPEGIRYSDLCLQLTIISNLLFKGSVSLNGKYDLDVICENVDMVR